MGGELNSPEYDEDRIAHILRRLRSPERALFASACAERLMPTYHWFCHKAGSENYGLVRQALDAAWSADALSQTTELALLQERVIAAQPRTAAGGMYLGSVVAQNALAGVAYALKVRLTGDVRAAVWAARQLYDAADAVIQQGAPVHTYITNIGQEAPVRMMVKGIAATLDAVTSPNVDDLRAKAQDDGARFLAFLTG